MRPLTRRGVTLVELVVALALLGLLATLAGVWLRGLRTAYRTESLEADRRQELRAAAAALPAELRELDAVDGDLVAMGPSAITIRAARQLRVLCRPPYAGAFGTLTLSLYDAPRYGLRDFRPGTDSLWILAQGDSLDPRPDWVRAAVLAVSPDTCPGDRPGRALTAALAPPVDSGRLARIPPGSPVLGFQPVTYRLYRSAEDDRWYIGQQSTGTIQPMLGPVTSDGLSFRYYAADGSETSQPRLVRLVEIRVRAPAPVLAGGARLPVDSVTAVVSLRNNPSR